MKRTPLKRISWLGKKATPKRPSDLTNPPKVSWLAKVPLRRVSKKMAHQKYQERKLEQRLLELCGNRCEICGQRGIFGLAKHEIITRGRQGDELDPLNCLILCTRGCHNHVKYPKTGTPLSIEEQMELAKRLHSCLLTSHQI